MTKRLTNADIAEIKKRVDKVAKGNLLVSLSALQTNNKVIFEDVPALLAEVERLQKYEKFLEEITKTFNRVAVSYYMKPNVYGNEVRELAEFLNDSILDGNPVISEGDTDA